MYLQDLSFCCHKSSLCITMNKLLIESFHIRSEVKSNINEWITIVWFIMTVMRSDWFEWLIVIQTLKHKHHHKHDNEEDKTWHTYVWCDWIILRQMIIWIHTHDVLTSMPLMNYESILIYLSESHRRSHHFNMSFTMKTSAWFLFDSIWRQLNFWFF